MDLPQHPFRFGVSHGGVSSRREWIAAVRRAEDLGYSTVFISDHFTEKLAPLPALVAAAEHTGMRVGTLVLANDFRHPAVLAKEAATLDLLTEGRLELGLGTGWARVDYQRSGIAMDPPGVRVERLQEAVAVLKGLLAGEEVSFHGRHYRVEWQMAPLPVQQPHPPLIIGGGGRRMLRLAGREADIVGLSVALPQGTGEELNREVGAAGGDALSRRLGWVAEGAGDRLHRLEINVLLFEAQVTARLEQTATEIAARRGSNPQAVLDSPHVAVGSVDAICDTLMERRRRYGISYLTVPQSAMEEMAPVVSRLAGA